MTDIVERLRIGGLRNELEAADEIARLRSDLAAAEGVISRLNSGAAADAAHAVGFREGAASMHKSQAAEIDRLRAALRPFAASTNSEDYIKTGPDNGLCAAMSYEVRHYRDARAALGEDKIQ